MLDRLSASHLYREVLCCERRGASEADESDAALQLAVVLQAAYHEPPQGLDASYGGVEFDDRCTPQQKTAVQRLTALTSGPQQPEARKRKAQRRKKARLPHTE